MTTTLITGANRGIGLELVRKFLAQGHDVIATARDPETSNELNATGAKVYPLEVTDAASVAALKEAVGDQPIDYLINNAGIGSFAAFKDLDYDAFANMLAVNTIAPIRMIDTFLDNIAASDVKMAASLSSMMGSIENTQASFGLIYRTSKAGLNMALRAAAPELAEKGVTLLALHPGWVNTDMGGKQAPVNPAQSAAGLYTVITTAGPSSELRFLDFEGKTHPW
ncbi:MULTISPECIES: SDR family oxidoreductase [unclassified Hyphomonas]|jgi:NAD(P)-dependent dehydrogenase (short-subunit alcohol dehydrogenase family)|uniref:Short-chain dehydrogenase/reductase (SDR) superfamily n=2 Tax=root TaxID=1 RepID=A0A160TWI9_9ZZZZ|nr:MULTISPECIES: SDR family oxidoreductase [unclassified Hyphomonas]MAL47602.1 short-chain dehydrogenase [Hyphomonas sp.]MAX84975.1 short-chain dehydrogenase [Hyphomonas sp.]MDF1805909.1 SDR family oxidoreductase [Hyphomonas sp.]RCL83980.1 MAG: SDR family NAD(P)-dependent oxidoreductase [Hyphomonas sp.]HAO36987.1 short-chain dehydrogenase [Hyphomonas sp.]|tara:strand:+ start:3629 stop:4300 length:672 start_codon:yes stop_codon:yes gene_type:complete